MVSVIIPTYNRAHLLPVAIDSVLAQRFTNLEIIIVDDGSTDNTREVLEGYKGKVRVIFQKNAGPSKARNVGVLAATGEYIAFLDSDDRWRHDKLSRQMEIMTRPGHDDIVCCLCNAEVKRKTAPGLTTFTLAGISGIPESGRWLNPLEVLLSRFVLFNQAALIRRDAAIRVGLFREDYWLLEDYDLALKLAELGPWAAIASPLVEYNWGNSDSLSTNASTVRMLQLMQAILVDAEKRLPKRPNSERSALRWRRTLIAIQLSAEMYSQRRGLGLVIGCVLRNAVKGVTAIYHRSSLFPRMIIT